MRITPLIAAALLVPLAAQSQIYKCPDTAGRTVVQQIPCTDGEKVDVRPASGTGNAYDDDVLPYAPLTMSATDAQTRGRADVATTRSMLKDPASAKFSATRVIAFRGDGRAHTLTCGFVNARNSFGGYTGPEPFSVLDGYPMVRNGTRDLPYQVREHKIASALRACTKTGTDLTP